MRRFHALLLGFGCVAAATSSNAAAVYVPVPAVAGATDGSTLVLGINDHNMIAGSYFTNDGIQHGFVGTLDGNYTTFDVGATFTDVRGIGNDGSVTGQADDSSGNLFPFQRLHNGTVKKITIDGQGFLNGLAQGFNSKGVFVGFGTTEDFHRHQFYAKKGKYRGEIPSSIGTVNTKAVDSSNNVAGDYFSTTDQAEHGVFLQNGTASTIYYPDKKAVNTYLAGLNDQGIAAGAWDNRIDSQHYKFVAFKVDINAAKFTELVPPHAKYSLAWGVNNSGLIAITSSEGSFIYCPTKKGCPKAGIEVPDAASIHVSSFATAKKSVAAPQ